MDKLLAFDYVVNSLQSWYIQEGGDLQNNDLSKLKITKLLFFVCAASTSNEDKGLLETFDNFYALPYGHVESDIYDQMINSAHYSISKYRTSFKEGVLNYVENLENDNVREIIDTAIEKLKRINVSLIKYDPFQLVELSHRWQSWKTVFSLAERNGKFSMKIPNEMIMVEPKIFR